MITVNKNIIPIINPLNFTHPQPCLPSSQEGLKWRKYTPSLIFTISSINLPLRNILNTL